MDAYQSQTNDGTLNATAPIRGVWNGEFDDETSETHLGNMYTFWGDLFETGVTLMEGTTQITSFDTKFTTPNGDTRYDILKGNEFIECKNYGTKNLEKPFSATFKKQFVGYLMNISSMNALKYYFKARYKQTTSTETEFKDIIKENFQKVFRADNYKIFDTIWNNQALRDVLFPGEDIKDEGEIAFIDLVNNFNSSLYSFINIK